MPSSLEDYENVSRARSKWESCLYHLRFTYKIAADQGHKGASFLKIRDLFIYLNFMAMLITITLGVYSQNAYHLAHAVENSFVHHHYYCNEARTNIFNVSGPQEVWCYLKKRLRETFIEQPFWDVKGTDSETILLTLPRFRQVRVKRENCLVPIVDIGCYGEFSSTTEDKLSYRNKDQDDTAWNYNGPELMGHLWFKGRVSYYNSAGYYFVLVDFSKLEYYEENNWIDRQTRALFIDFTFYNINVNLFCVCQILFEFPPSGGVIPSYLFTPVKLIRYNDHYDHIVLACEIVFAFYCLYYTTELIIELIYFKSKFFKTYHNWVDLLVLSISWASVVVLWYRQHASKEFIENHVDEIDEDFTDYQELKYIQLAADRTTAVTLFCTFMKMYRYLHFDTIDLLFTTLRYCLRDMINFFFLFVVILFAYAQLGTLLFSHYLESYKTIEESSFTLLKTVMGEFEYQYVMQVFSLLGPVYIVSFVMFVVFLLLNMLMAIINATFTVVSTNVKITRRTEYLPFLKHCVTIFLGKLHISLPSNPKPMTNRERIRQIMIDSGFSELEMDMFFSRYTIDNEREVPDVVFQRIVNQKLKPEDLEELKGRVKDINAIVNSAIKKKERFLYKVQRLTGWYPE